MYTLRCILFTVVACITGFAWAGGVGNVTAEADGFAPSWVEDPDGRGTLTIVYSSAITLFLAAWATLHLNIPLYRETGGPKILWRSIKAAFYSFLFPEFAVILAHSERSGAQKFRDELNAAEEQYRLKDPSLADQVVHKRNTPFTTLYAWYAEMGGFCVQTDAGMERHIDGYNQTRRPFLTRTGLLLLASHGHFLYMDDQSIDDKSKADYLAKTLLSIQIFWFVCQAVQRKIAGLPISLLEFRVFVNVCCGLLTYWCWWYKPRGIGTATVG